MPGKERVQEHAAPLDDAMLDGTTSVFITGVLHVIHNCVKDSGSALERFDAWVESLSQVEAQCPY